ncbi:MAG: tetratricopeptide repeat protein [Micavibrio sp.]
MMMIKTNSLFRGSALAVVFAAIVLAAPHGRAVAQTSAFDQQAPSAATGFEQDAPAASGDFAPPSASPQMPSMSYDGGAPAGTAPPMDPMAQQIPSSPPDAELTTSVLPLPEAAEGDLQGTNVMGQGATEPQHSGTYYDADAVIPGQALSGRTSPPRKVDPAREPGQRYVVVGKNAPAGSYEAQYVAATRALKLGRYAAAMEILEGLYATNHKDTRVLMGLAIAQQGAGFNESAARTYEDLLKLQPNNADAIINLMGLMRTQYPSVTLQKLGDLRRKYPHNPGIPAQMGLINAELNNYQDSVRYFEIAASMEPRNSSHIYNMAIVVDRAGDVAKAIQLYERALQIDASHGSNANTIPRDEIYDRLVVLRRKA